MEIRSIKGVGEEKWMEFKSLAAKKNVSLGELFALMLADYRKRSELVWNRILNGEKILSDSEALELEKTIKELRKEKGFRI